MSVMPAFSSTHPVCPKCQRSVGHTRFCSADRHNGPIVPDCTVANAGEHLHRMCECGYFWVERCADASLPQEIEVERVAIGVGSPTAARASTKPAPVARGGAEELRTRPVEARPAGAPGGIGGGASEEEREDIVTLASDESFPASDPPAY